MEQIYEQQNKGNNYMYNYREKTKKWKEERKF